MPVVAVINYKGGVGKTTIVANLAAELAWRGRKILLLDLDAQASLTFSFIRPDKWEQDLEQDRTIKSWFDSFESGSPISLDSLIFQPDEMSDLLSSRTGELHLLASHLGLINVDLELATSLGGANLSQTKKNFLKVHSRLRDGLSSLEDVFDMILIDCPPNFNIVTKNAIVASEFILVPAKPDYLSTMGIDYLRRQLSQLVHDFNEYARLGNHAAAETIDPQIMGVVFTMIQIYGGGPISSQRPYVSQIRNLDVPVFDNWIRENKTIFADAPAYGVPVVLKSVVNRTQKDVRDEIRSFVSEFERSISWQPVG